MKKMLAMTMVVVSVFCAMESAGRETSTATTEVYVNIPGEKPVHCPAAQVEIKGDGIVVVTTPWGVTYITHMANVVIVKRKSPASR